MPSKTLWLDEFKSFHPVQHRRCPRRLRALLRQNRGQGFPAALCDLCDLPDERADQGTLHGKAQAHWPTVMGYPVALQL